MNTPDKSTGYKGITRGLVYILITLITTIVSGMTEHMTSYAMVKLGLSAILTALVAIRAYIDQTLSRETSGVDVTTQKVVPEITKGSKIKLAVK